MSITYDQTTNKIVVSGGDEENPLTFEDIYTADQNNGWNVFHKVGNNVYKTDARLKFINCVFKEYNSSLIIENLGVKPYSTVVHFTSNSNCEFEYVSFWNYDANYVSGYTIDNNAVVIFRECAFYNNSRGKSTVFKGTGSKCVFERCYSELYHMTLKAEFIDVIIGGRYGFISRPPEGCVFKNLTMITKYDHCFWITEGDYLIDGGKYDSANVLAGLRNTNCLKIKNANLLRTNIKIHNDEGITTRFIISYDILFRILDKDGNPAYKKLKITDKNGNVIFDDTVSEQFIELPLYTFEFTGDGQWHNFTEEDYNCHIPYLIEVYDELKTYYRGYITELSNVRRVIEITITDELPDVLSLMYEIRAVAYTIRNMLYRLGMY